MCTCKSSTESINIHQPALFLILLFCLGISFFTFPEEITHKTGYIIQGALFGVHCYFRITKDPLTACYVTVESADLSDSMDVNPSVSAVPPTIYGRSLAKGTVYTLIIKALLLYVLNVLDLKLETQGSLLYN